jgi:hypothetical protein
MITILLFLHLMTPYEADCAREGFTNWGRPIYKKGVMIKWECFDSTWKHKVILLPAQAAP